MRVYRILDGSIWVRSPRAYLNGTFIWSSEGPDADSKFGGQEWKEREGDGKGMAVAGMKPTDGNGRLKRCMR